MPESPRLIFENDGGMNTVQAPDLLPPTQYSYLQNVRKLLGGRLVARYPLGANLLASALGYGITSVARLNDPYSGPGFALVTGAAGNMYVGVTEVVAGLSGNPLSFLPSTPPSTPQPWCYVADPSLAVSILNPSYSGYTGPLCGMVKTRADGTTYKIGIMEPQVAPAITVTSAPSPYWVTYRYRYRSKALGAQSNPSPESVPQQVEVTSLQGMVTASEYATNLSFNASQYQYNSSGGGQIRTAGGVAPGTLTDYVVAFDFGLAVPSGAQITGVQIALNWNGQNSGTGVWAGAALFYQGAQIGEAKAPGIQNTQSGGTDTQGGVSDAWGAILSPTVVNDTTFGFGVQLLTEDAGGSDRSFMYTWTVTIYYASLSATGNCTLSTDPQVDTIDVFRQTPGLDNFTYTLSIPNSGSGDFTDSNSDLAIVANPILSFTNYEPFPSIDLPRSGTLNSDGAGNLTWVSGDDFNVRWLPGSSILISDSTGSQIAYVLYNRPSSTTAMKAYTTTTTSTGFITFGFPPAGTGLQWQMIAPDLASQPSPAIWGPTPENAGSFYFGLDQLNPGDLVWSLGNNFDSADSANRMTVTSASETLQNGTVTSELSTVFSTERFWLIYPNFSDAVATVTGTLGQQWTLVQSAATRGLFLRYAIAALGSLIAWRAKDGIFISNGGGPEQDISANIYNLFPHGEPEAPAPVVIGSQTVYPPDDTNPNAQTMAMVPGYIFYNYQDTTGTQRTLVYDMAAKGWTVDAYSPLVNCHALAVGVNQILAGCVDGTVRAFDAAGSETGTAIVATQSQNGGSARTTKRIGGVFVRALAATAITPQFWSQRFGAQITGFSPATIGTNAAEADYLTDFTAATGADVLDLGCIFSWALGSGNWLKEWQPDWTEIPEQIVAWRTGMLSYGLQGWLHIPWLRFAYQSTAQVNLTLTTDQGAAATLAIPSSGGVPAKFFTWVPPSSGGVSMKFRMLELSGDAGGTPWACYAKDIEMAIKEWGSTGPYKVIRPFSGDGFGVPGSTT